MRSKRFSGNSNGEQNGNRRVAYPAAAVASATASNNELRWLST